MPRPRNAPRLKPLKTMKIFCEGEKTEPNYLRGYLGVVRNPTRRSVIEVQKTPKTTPIQLVNEAVKAKKLPTSLPEDEFWVVYDRESEDKYSHALHARARDKARRSGVKIAICNVCFEYWLLIHLEDTTASYSSFDDLRKRSSLYKEVKKKFGFDYEKSNSSIFSFFQSNIAVARRRALLLNMNGRASADPHKSEPHHINPYIGIIELLDAIDNFA